MKTKAVRIYGKQDLRLEEFELPAMQDDEILACIVSDSICMSSYKAAMQGADHKRIPDDVANNPVIVGHEFCGEILEVGSKWADQFKPGDRFIIQTALNAPENVYAAPGYTFPYIGGAATHVIIPEVVMRQKSLIRYEGDAFYFGSLAEPMSCIAGCFNVSYHTKPGSYEHIMGIVEGGNLAIMAGVGPMGLGAIDFAIHNPRRPGLLVVTDINQDRLDRAAQLYSPEEAARNGVKLHYLNTKDLDDVPKKLFELSGGEPYDDVFVYAPVAALVEQAGAVLGYDGCLNFFAGPTDPAFSARFNFYDVHYNNTHVAGNSGGTTEDMIEAVDLMTRGLIDPSSMITHIGGLDSVVETTLNLPDIPGGKKLVYTQIKMPLIALADLAKMGETDPVCRGLAEIVAANKGIWNAKAEKYLLEHAERI